MSQPQILSDQSDIKRRMLPPPERLRFVCGVSSAKVSAETFFQLLKEVGVTALVDTRVNRDYDRARFSHELDLPYICSRHGVEYILGTVFMPTQEIRQAFHESFTDKRSREERDPLAWTKYLEAYEALLRERRPLRQGVFYEKVLNGSHQAVAMLCACEHADDCHRSLALGVIGCSVTDVKIRHLYPDGKVPKRTSPRRYRLHAFPNAGLLADGREVKP